MTTTHDAALEERLAPGPQEGRDEAPGDDGGARAPENGAASCAATRTGNRAEAGMATAEYAIGTVAAAAFAGLLLVILRGDAIRNALEGIIQSALSLG